MAVMYVLGLIYVGYTTADMCTYVYESMWLHVSGDFCHYCDLLPRPPPPLPLLSRIYRVHSAIVL